MNLYLTRVFRFASFRITLPLVIILSLISTDSDRYNNVINSLEQHKPSPTPTITPSPNFTPTPNMYPYPVPTDNLTTPFYVYPPPIQLEVTQSIPSRLDDPFLVYLSLLLKSGITTTHFYAQSQKQGIFYGVSSLIETADPVLREPLFSYASINIIGPGGYWIETGWIKTSVTGCIPRFSWATQVGGGDAHIIETPTPIVGEAYKYYIQRVSPGNWRLYIARLDGLVLVTVDIPNVGLDYGEKIQALGEVDSATRVNDMGVLGLRSLLWLDSDSHWHYWDGWSIGVVDDPYILRGISTDPYNNVQVYGNNGNPIPPGAPCP